MKFPKRNFKKEKALSNEDEEMASANRVQLLSTAVFEALEDKGISKRTLQLLEEDVQGEKVDDMMKTRIKNAVFATYGQPRLHLSETDLVKATGSAIANLRAILSQPHENKLRLYEGDADVRFQNYLASCCDAYMDDTDIFRKYTAPYVTITQSSGFGKTRILKRLAEKQTPIEHNDAQFDVKVLYCGTTFDRSSRYSCLTPQLRKWLLSDYNWGEERIDAALEKAFRYSIENADAREKWLKLFEEDEDYSVVVKHELDKVKLRPSTYDLPLQKRKKLSVTPVLVVAIDKTETKDNNGTKALQFLRRALIAVNKNSTIRCANGLVFGVLVDTNPLVHKYAVADMEILSSRIGHSRRNPVLFPPFVLTETMDIMMEKLRDDQRTSKNRVLTTDEDDVWMALVSMGRPLWRSIDDTRSDLASRKVGMVLFAARKMLIGHVENHSCGYTDSTLYGVASLFCRLGLRPNLFSPIAPLQVANLMSVLHYVTYTNDAYISGYVSEPILAFGASEMWHAFEQYKKPSALEQYILPQFRTMLLSKEIDTSNISEPVSRIFLLLAMDALEKASWKFVFSGQFCDVQKFVKILVGDNPQIREGDAEVIDEEEIESYKKWMESWNGWQVCFSHFVDLKKEPTKDDLWKLLDRRAAGVLPREQLGADLIIPIFHPRYGDVHPEGSVSFILVHVENRADGDGRFPDSALRELSPSYVFKETDDPSSLHMTGDNEMIRLYLSLLEVANETTSPAQCIVTEKMATDHDKVAPEFNGSLCVRGVLTPNYDERDEMHHRWPFLTKGLIEILHEIANTEWDGKAQVENDLKSRSDHEKETRQSFSLVQSKDTVLEKASHTMNFV